MAAAVRMLGANVPPSLLPSWRSWLAPAVQPFFVAGDLRRRLPAGAAGEMTGELRDTYAVWRVDRSLDEIWLDEESFSALPRLLRGELVRAQVRCRRDAVPTVRAWAPVSPAAAWPAGLRQQADGHRFVWWAPLVDAGGAVGVLERFVTSFGALPSQHGDVAESTWRAAAPVVPGARELAGTFPPSSGPNCFGTVMGGCGVAGAAGERVLQEPFDTWLRSSARRGGDDERPGTVLVWRGVEDGLPVHAAVTIGDGWAFEKGSQCWYTPRVVLPVADVVRLSRSPGVRLERWTLRD